MAGRRPCAVACYGSTWRNGHRRTDSQIEAVCTLLATAARKLQQKPSSLKAVTVLYLPTRYSNTGRGIGYGAFRHARQIRDADDPNLLADVDDVAIFITWI